MPHAGTFVPDGLRARLTPVGETLPDTDWYVDELYDFAPALGAGLLVATHHRCVVDLNRSPDDTALYDGAGTGLLPTATFDGEPLYRPGEGPGPEERARRLADHWAPYHDALAGELDRLRDRHGYALLLDAHSIRSRVPRLFTGELPALNFGSFGGRSAAPSLVDRAVAALGGAEAPDLVVDGRFIGGYITRHYGRPDEGRHALQLEMAQRVYMQEEPPRRRPDAMAATARRLRGLVQALLEWRPGD